MQACASFDEAGPILLDTEKIMYELSTPVVVPKLFLRHNYRSKSCPARSSSNHRDFINDAGVSESSQHILSGESSIKLRILNRIASGFDAMVKAYNPSLGNYSQDRGQQLYSGGVQIRPDRAQNRSGGDQNRISADIRSVTAPSFSSRSSFGSDLKSIIASFPAPPGRPCPIPISTLTTQNSRITTRNSFEPSYSARPLQMETMASEDTGFVGVTLAIMPEMECVVTSDLEGGVEFFVAIELRGTLCTTTQNVEALNGTRDLDLAIVIDNS